MYAFRGRGRGQGRGIGVSGSQWELVGVRVELGSSRMARRRGAKSDYKKTPGLAQKEASLFLLSKTLPGGFHQGGKIRMGARDGVSPGGFRNSRFASGLCGSFRKPGAIAMRAFAVVCGVA